MCYACYMAMKLLKTFLSIAFLIVLSALPVNAQTDYKQIKTCYISRNEINEIVKARDKYLIPYGLMIAVAYKETKCNNSLVGAYGELCMFQIFPYNSNPKYGFTDRPHANNLRIIDVCADTAAKILRENHDRYCKNFTFNYIFDFDDLDAQWYCALSVYNSGTSVYKTGVLSLAGAKYASDVLDIRESIAIYYK